MEEIRRYNISVCSEAVEKRGVLNSPDPTTRHLRAGSLGVGAMYSNQESRFDDAIPGVFRKRKHPGQFSGVDLCPAD